ncbi:MAG: hypothetical protein HYU52_16645 [Acidobacteria bacterium]|nr:hypothetical protein [Acidobacteriota bacterium]
MNANGYRGFGPLSVLLLSLALPAAAIESVYVIPAAAHVRGLAGSEWMTDLVLHNPGSAAVTIDVALVRSGAAALVASGLETLGAAVVAPGQTVLLADLLGSALSADASGALILSGTGPFTATSRTYVERPDGTRGTAISVARVFIDESEPSALLSGVRVEGRYRTNIGIFALADGEDRLEIEVTIGGAVIQRLVVPAGTFAHAQLPVESTGGSGVATATVGIVAGQGFATAYASVIDNGSDDATLIEPVAFESEPAARRGNADVELRLRRALGHTDPGGDR